MEGIGIYFLRKRDLSDQYQGGDERKKQRKEVQQVQLTILIFLVKDRNNLTLRLFYLTV